MLERFSHVRDKRNLGMVFQTAHKEPARNKTHKTNDIYIKRIHTQQHIVLLGLLSHLENGSKWCQTM